MPESHLTEMLELAKRVAIEAADMALPRMGRSNARLKADSSIVTDVDGEIQAHILRAIGSAFSDHAIVAEEEQGNAASRPGPTKARFCWVIDPLDGTRNFATGFPAFSTSIAVLDGGRPVVGVVFGHNIKTLYAATLGDGTTVNGAAVPTRPTPPDSDLVIGIPSSKDSLTAAVACRWIEARGMICRNLGSTALHLGILSAGGLSGVFCKRCKIWDVAAGALLVTEAGGRVTNLRGVDLLTFDLSQDPEADIPILATTADANERLLASIHDLVT